MIAGIVAGYPVASAPVAWATWNPADKAGNVLLSNGDRTATHNGSPDGVNGLVRSTTGKSSGKHYVEIVADVVTASPFALIGLAPSSLATTAFPGSSSTSYGYYQDDGQKFNNNTGAAFGSPWENNGDVVGLAVNMDDGELEYFLNGVSQGVAFTGITGTMFIALSLYRNLHQVTARFDPADQTYSPPSGFTAGWNA